MQENIISKMFRSFAFENTPPYEQVSCKPVPESHTENMNMTN